MYIIKSPLNDPYFNIASEEYILKNFKSDVFLLYINEPSIIVGRYQNTISQLNLEYIKENNIKVVRRLTGGGAVFHDLGNLNFSFICQKSQQNHLGFERYTEPIIRYMQKLGVDARLQGRNDLVIAGRKFSGNARLTTENKVLQHGTLLYSARMNDLLQALKSDPLKFDDKSVKSIKSRVTNISDHLPEFISVQDFETGLIDFITSSYAQAIPYVFNLNDINRIKALSKAKYQTWEWNYGSSPEYNFDKSIKTKSGILEARMLVINGVIKELQLNGDFFTRQPLDGLTAALINCRHSIEDVNKVIDKLNLDDYIIDLTRDDLICALF